MLCLSYTDFAWRESAIEDIGIGITEEEVINEIDFLRAVLYDVMERWFDAAILNFKKEVNYTEDLRNGYTKTTY